MPTRGDYEYTATLSDAQILATLKNIDKNMESLAQKGDKAFKSIGASAAAGGLSIGAITGIVTALTSKFLELAQAAVQTFISISEEAIKLNSNLEQARVTFTNVFGNTEDADRFIQFLKEISTQLGVSTDAAVGFAKSLTPDTKSQDEFKNLLRVGATLAKDQQKSLEEARFAIEEAIGGNFISLEKRFNLPKATVDKIKELGKEIGVVPALIQVLDERFAKTGVTLEKFTDTFQATVDRVTSRAQDIETAFGKPLFDEAKDQLAGIEDILIRNEDKFKDIAGDLGAIGAELLQFGGDTIQDFLNSLDPDRIQDFLLQVQDVVEVGKVLITVMAGWGAAAFEAVKAFDALGSLLGITSGSLSDVSTEGTDFVGVLIAITEFIGKSAAGVKGLTASVNVAVEALARSILAVKALQAGQVELAFDLAKQAADSFSKIDDAAKEPTEGALKDLEARLKSLKAALAENAQQARDRAKAQDEDTTAVENWNTAAGEATDNAEELAKAQQKVQDAMDKFNTEKARDELDAQIKAERQAIDAALDAARKREDIARKNAQKIEDIHQKNEEAIADAGTDLSRKEQDIARDAARKRVDIDRQAAQKRVDIETAFRRKLEDIQRQFNQSARDAERSRDAVAFIRAQEQRQQAIQSATTERDRGLQDVGTQQGRDKEQARIDAEQARQDAELENQRKLEDLQTNLDRELEAQQEANQRELEEQALAEERKQEDLRTAQEREAEDRATANQRKLEDLQKSLADELALIQQGVQATAAAEAQKTAIVQEESQKRVEAARKAAQEMASLDSKTGGEGRHGPTGLAQPSATPFSGGHHTPGFASGGNFPGGGPILVGERGPELLMPTTPGVVIPNHKLSSALATLGSGGRGSSTTNIDQSVKGGDFNLVDPNAMDAIARAVARQEVLKILSQMRRGGR